MVEKNKNITMKMKWIEKEVLLHTHVYAVTLLFLIASVKDVLTADEVFLNRLHENEKCKLLDVSQYFLGWDSFTLSEHQPEDDGNKDFSLEHGSLYSSDCSHARSNRRLCFKVVKKLVNKYSFLNGRECIFIDKALDAKNTPGNIERRNIFSEKNYNLYVPFPWRDQYVNIKQIIFSKRTTISCQNKPEEILKLLDGETVFISQKVQNDPQANINCVLQHDEIVNNLRVHFENNIDVLARKRRNTPIYFEKSFYSTEVKEDAPLFKVILTLKVLGGSGNYVFSKAEDPKTDAIFRIDGKTGNVILLQKLNREDGAERFSIDAKVSDISDPSNSIVTPIKIKVLDVNDNSPVFDQTSYKMTVDEGQASNKYILTVKASDPDDGLNREIIYSIVEKPNIKIPFQIDRKSGAIKNTEVLDREKNPYFNFTVKAEDQGVPKLSSSVMVSISLRDINDNSPKFSKSVYKLSILENTTVGSTVFKLDVTDSDIGMNGVIRFNPLPGTRFRINTTTGEIILNEAVDYDIYQRFSKFSVVAFDKGSPPNHAGAEVEVIKLLCVCFVLYIHVVFYLRVLRGGGGVRGKKYCNS